MPAIRQLLLPSRLSPWSGNAHHQTMQSLGDQHSTLLRYPLAYQWQAVRALEDFVHDTSSDFPFEFYCHKSFQRFYAFPSIGSRADDWSFMFFGHKILHDCLWIAVHDRMKNNHLITSQPFIQSWELMYRQLRLNNQLHTQCMRSASVILLTNALIMLHIISHINTNTTFWIMPVFKPLARKFENPDFFLLPVKAQ